MEAIPHAAVAALLSSGKMEREGKNVMTQLAKAIMSESKAGRETCHINIGGVGPATVVMIQAIAKDQGYQMEDKILGGMRHLFLFWGSALGTVVKSDEDQAKAAAVVAPPPDEAPPVVVKVERKPVVLSEEERQKRRDRMAKARATKAAKNQKEA